MSPRWMSSLSLEDDRLSSNSLFDIIAVQLAKHNSFIDPSPFIPVAVAVAISRCRSTLGSTFDSEHWFSFWLQPLDLSPTLSN